MSKRETEKRQRLQGDSKDRILRETESECSESDSKTKREQEKVKVKQTEREGGRQGSW